MRKKAIKTRLNYLPSSYTLKRLNYLRTTSKMINPHIRTIISSCPHSQAVPAYRTALTISKILLLNQLQAVQLAQVIEVSRWNIDHQTIAKSYGDVGDLLCSSNDGQIFKKFVLYLLLVIFQVKKTFNQDLEDIVAQVKKLCPNFIAVYLEWRQHIEKHFQCVSLRSLNTTFQYMQNQNRKVEPNYNIVTDEIIRMSPAYCVQKRQRLDSISQINSNEKPPTKKVKTESYLSEDQIQILKYAPTFSGSGLVEMLTQAENNILDEENKMSIFGSAKIGNSSFFHAMNSRYYEVSHSQMSGIFKMQESEINIFDMNSQPKMEKGMSHIASKIESKSQLNQHPFNKNQDLEAQSQN